jgi:hypothetical protein
MTVALAINRLVYLTSPLHWTVKLYDGKRVWIWVIVAHLFGWVIFIPYNTPYATMIVDTKLGIYVWPENIDEVSFVENSVSEIVQQVRTLLRMLDRKCTVCQAEVGTWGGGTRGTEYTSVKTDAVSMCLNRRGVCRFADSLGFYPRAAR